MREMRQWQRWALPTFATITVLAAAVFPAWIVAPVATSAAVLYLIFTPVTQVPPQ